MTIEFLEEYRSRDGRHWRIGQLADLPIEEARELVRTGRAREFTVEEEEEGE